MRPIRVVYPSSMASGGSERQMLTLAAHLPRDRFAVEFIVLGDRTPQSDEAEALGLPVHVLGAGRVGRRGFVATGRAAAVAITGFVKQVRMGRYDIVDAWLFHGYALAALTRPFTRVPVLIAGRRITSDTKAGFSVADRALDAIARHVVDLVVANSEDVARDVIAREGLDPADVRVIRNGVAIPEMPDRAWIDARRDEWAVPRDAIVVGVVANFRPEKELEVLIDALAIRPVRPDVRVVFVGDGPLRPEIELASERAGLAGSVRFLGRVPDARPLIAALDVLVSSSRSEGLSNSILEAAAAGVPVVATRAPGSAEIVLDGETGFLVPVGDAAALRIALDQILDDRDLRLRMGAAGRRDVERRFGIARLVAETAALYEGLVATRGLAR